MQIEHYAMLLIAIGALFAVRKQSVGIASVLWSQAPFWIGSSVFFMTGGFAFWPNLGMDLLCAAGFLLAAHMFNFWWLIWCCIFFVIATLVDIFALTFGLSNYVVLHEMVHYAALISIAGGKYVDQVSHFIHRTMRGNLADN